MNTTTCAQPRVRSFARRMDQLKPSAIREILKTTERPGTISFAGGLPAAELFPVELIRGATERVLTDDAPGALQYSVTEGYTPLREWAAARLGARGVPASPHRVLITHGSQQGLDLIGKVLLDRGDTVLVETPAYLGALQAFQAYEARIVGLPSDDQGLRADALRETLRSLPRPPKFLYAIPNFQNPTGTSMSAERRREVARVAAEHRLLVVEDDPYGELHYDTAPPPPLSAEDGLPQWVHLGTASKLLAPGLRVAWLATNDSTLFERLVTAKQSTDLHTSSFTQRVVFRAVEQTQPLEKHLAGIRLAYRSRRDAMLDCLGRFMPPGTRWTRPAGGMFLWVTLPGAADTLELLPRAGDLQVAYVPGHPFWVGAAPTNTLRLNFSFEKESNIERGINRLGQALGKLPG